MSLTGDDPPPLPIWTPAVLPSVLAVVPLPEDLAGPTPAIEIANPGKVLLDHISGLVIEQNDTVIRIHAEAKTQMGGPCAALIPLDTLVDVRASFLLHAGRALTGRPPGRNPSALPIARRSRLVLSLRAFDAHRGQASHRQIAEGLFGRDRLPERGWKTHDLRERTIRLVRDGVGLMKGGYRQLLVYPYRRKL